MLPTTREWVSKAEGDYGTVCVLLKSRKPWRYDVICFHSQQCAEKYLKARLVEGSVAFPKTHDLDALLRLALSLEPTWIAFWPEITLLAVWSVQPRYPGTNATAAKMRDSVKAIRRFRAAARIAFGLKP